MNETTAARLREAGSAEGTILFLTGAGISAESGIPTFRGKDGYWTVGSEVYHPQEMATQAAFRVMPKEVWRWYLYRRTVCRAAEPNQAHLALVDLERALGDRFCLITQNVDGLHVRAGQSEERTYHCHGNIDQMRCVAECGAPLMPVPEGLDGFDRDRELDDAEFGRLICAACGGPSRPHVLWFDEYYDEALFRFDSSLRAARAATILITVGSSGATNLPNQVVQVAASSDAYIVDVNPDPNPFGDAAEQTGGEWIAASAGEAVPALTTALTPPDSSGA